MTFTSPFSSLCSVVGMRWAVGAACLAAAAAGYTLAHRPAAVTVALAGPVPRTVAQDGGTQAQPFARLRKNLQVFRGAVAASSRHSFGADFRFAGTFTLYGGTAGDSVFRRAVVAYRPSGTQHVVSEGARMEGVTVQSIGPDELVLEKAGAIARLSLAGFGETDRVASQAATAHADDAVEAGENAGGDQFGTRTDDGIWHMDRTALLGYYEELLDEPERLLQVFDSMRPIYTEAGSIEGYRLDPVGEEKFFAGVGLQEGDTVRSVNSLPMTNRRRAEFFIRQVVEQDMSAVVIDLEREGEPVRMVYEIR